MVVEISCEEVWREISNYLEGESALLSIGLEGEERSSKWVRAPSTIEGPDLDRFREALRRKKLQNQGQKETSNKAATRSTDYRRAGTKR